MSDYSGHVEPGGPAISRTIDIDGTSVEIRKLSVGSMDNNAYVIRDTGSNQALLVDAADDPDRLLAEVEGLDLIGIFTTHGHFDHWQALAPVADATGAPVWLHPGDAEMVPRPADRAAEGGATITVGGVQLQMIHTPGHTPGSTCLLLGDHLFTGDTLFPGGPGNTFGNAAAFAQIMDSLESRLFILPDQTWVYPGHGDDTTLGAERPSLSEWHARGW
jgi:glyoxylase-like metal-dependent hydrolase (beta-lactamase superfamily II)